jgi:hypothetical protein
MSDFKNRLQQDIINPAEHLRRLFTIVGTVTKVDEKNNVCSVSFIDKDGYKSNKNNVPVVIYNSSIIDWFPKEGEMVNIEQEDELIRIVSKYEGAYTVGVRASIELKKDIHTTAFTDTCGGYVF